MRRSKEKIVEIPKVDRRDTYFIGAYSKNGKLKAIKVGSVAHGQVQQRLRNLQTGSVDRLALLVLYRGNIERKVHRAFAKYRLRRNSEYFKPVKSLLQLIDDLLSVSKVLALIEKQAETTSNLYRVIRREERRSERPSFHGDSRRHCQSAACSHRSPQRRPSSRQDCTFRGKRALLYRLDS